MPTLKHHYSESIKDGAKSYVEDLEAMPHEQLNSCPGGSARTGYDMTYEVAVVNERISTRLSGGDPGKWPFEGWVVAPDDFKAKETAIARFQSSVEKVLKSLEGLDDELSGSVMVQENEQKFEMLVGMVQWHMAYHLGQLNYIQSLHGDMEMHWK